MFVALYIIQIKDVFMYFVGELSKAYGALTVAEPSI